jgi:ketosteroid isomerase-like protein
VRDIFCNDEDHAALATWFDAWGDHVAAVDFTGARALFEDDVIGFGTWMDVVDGLTNLEAAQWRSIWPTITEFRFLTDTLRVRVSPDRCFAVGVVVWDSIGFHQDGTAYPRPGRATVAFRRAGPDAPWKGFHTHLSLNRGVPQRSYGKPDATTAAARIPDR